MYHSSKPVSLTERQCIAFPPSGMDQKINKYLITALLIGLVFHGAGVFFTLETTYDALIHLFFANHYANSWFEPWNYSWYTGFTVMGYPGQYPDNLIQHLYSIKNQGNGLGRIKIIIHNLLKSLLQACQFCGIIF